MWWSVAKCCSLVLFFHIYGCTWLYVLYAFVYLCRLYILIVMFMYSYTYSRSVLYPDWGFSRFFLSCKANARVYLAKTGHGPHFFLIVLFSVLFFVDCVVLCIVLCRLCCSMYCFVSIVLFMYCLCVNVYYCHRVSIQLQLNIYHIISYHIISYNNPFSFSVK